MARKTSTDVQNKIVDEIAARGPVDVAEFMRRAVAEYYAHADSIGAAGDFTTAPEISQMFGEVLAAWLVDKWLAAGAPAPVNVVELGPGRGTLMADMMRVMTSFPALRAAGLRVHLVEFSPRLRALQNEKLGQYAPVWHDDISSLPDGFGLYVANEFFDALPVHQFVKQPDGWAKRVVAAKDGALVFDTLPVDAKGPCRLMPAAFVDAQEGSVFEICPQGVEIMETLAKRMQNFGGAGLVIDYGHVESGLGETLQSVSGHKCVPVLENAGRQDITAHVDFQLLAAAALAYVEVHGPQTQGVFLKAQGIVERAQILAAKATPQQRGEIERALYRLTATQEMGALFKVLGLTGRGETHENAAG